MMRFTRILAVGVCVAAVCCGAARADLVVLKDGTLLEGRVTNRAAWITIEFPEGILRVPMRRVFAVHIAEPERAAKQVSAPAAPTAPNAGSAAEDAAKEDRDETPDAQPRRETKRPPRVADVLKSRMDVNFDGVSAFEAVTFIQQSTGVNMAISGNVRADRRPVTLHVDGVRVSVILDLVLKPLGMGYKIEPGEIIHVTDRPIALRTVRIYDVRDLIINKGDVTGGDDDDDDDDNSTSQNDDDDDDDEETTGGMYARSRELRELIMLACCPEAWQAETRNGGANW